jgi:hypothetical protein
MCGRVESMHVGCSHPVRHTLGAVTATKAVMLVVIKELRMSLKPINAAV